MRDRAFDLVEPAPPVARVRRRLDSLAQTLACKRDVFHLVAGIHADDGPEPDPSAHRLALEARDCAAALIARVEATAVTADA